MDADVEDDLHQDRCAGEVDQVERELDRCLARPGEGDARTDDDAQQVLARVEREEADDGRKLAQREGVLLAFEVDVNDL